MEAGGDLCGLCAEEGCFRGCFLSSLSHIFLASSPNAPPSITGLPTNILLTWCLVGGSDLIDFRFS